MIGAIIGDIAGSPYEAPGKRIKTEDFPFYSESSRFTDDTVMTLAVGEGILNALEKEKTENTRDREDGKVSPENDFGTSELTGEEPAEEEPDDLLLNPFTGALYGAEPVYVTAPDDDLLKQELIRSMQRLGRQYPDAGYGGMFIQWLADDHPEPYGSFGNGSAMRVSAAAWFFNDMDVVRHVARVTAEVTHNHPEGIKGAEATAAAIFLAREEMGKEEIRNYIEQEFGYDLHRSLDDIRPKYTFDVSCQGSVPEAILCFLEGEDFEDAVRLAVSMGGDSDTMAAIAGSIADAYTSVPAYLASGMIPYLDENLWNILMRCEDHIAEMESAPLR